MIFHLGTIIGTIVTMGILGGIINYFIDGNETENEENAKKQITKAVVIGIGAALLVPLFLNMGSSRLLEETESSYNKLLVFAGFCLIAAITSKTFISSIAERIIKQAQEANKNAKNAEDIAQQMKMNIDPILAKETEQDYFEEKIVGKNIPIDEDNIDVIEVLMAFIDSSYTYRSLNGISRVVKATKEIVGEKLDELTANGLVAQIVRGSELRYFITEKGRRELCAYKKIPGEADICN